MRSIRCLLLISIYMVFSNSAYGQNLSKKQAIDFAEKLYEVEILSEKGKKFLVKTINEGDFERTRGPNPIDGSMSVSNELSVSQILIFLSKAFGGELYYRTGVQEQNKMLKDIQREKGNVLLTQEDYNNIQAEFSKRMEKFEGQKLENAIVDEENFPEDTRSISLDGFSMPYMQEYGLIHKNRSVLGKTCTRTLQDIYDVGLINKVVFEEALQLIRQNNLVFEVYVTAYAYERITYYEDFEENKSKEVKFIQGLNEAGIISNEKKNELIESYKPFELKTKFEILEYCSNTKTFELKDYSMNPEIGYKEIFTDIRTLVPNFNFENFRASIKDVENPWDDDLIEQKGIITFKVDSTNYYNSFFYDYKRKNPKENEKESDTLLKISNEFHKGINKLLADRNSSYRLYYANKSDDGGVYGKQKFGLILLTEEQFKAWGTYNSDYFLFNQSHDNSFNTSNIQIMIDEYKSLGLFDHLTDNEVRIGENCVSESVIENHQSILSCFPKTIVYFDWETGNLENPYESIIKKFSEASRGDFKPTNIVDTFENSWEHETTGFSFDSNGKNYSADLKMDGDWLDSDFLTLIKQSMIDSNIGSQIYYCLDDGQAGGYIVLTDKQYSMLKTSQPELFKEFND